MLAHKDKTIQSQLQFGFPSTSFYFLENCNFWIGFIIISQKTGLLKKNPEICEKYLYKEKIYKVWNSKSGSKYLKRKKQIN